VGDALALDAGALTDALTLEEQERLSAIVLTHAHLDHIASLPFLVENVFGRTGRPVEIAAPAEVLDALRTHLFNDVLWPDFSRLPDHREPTVTFRTLAPCVPNAIGGVSVTPVVVSHVVPTFGYVLDDGASSVVISGDTGPTNRFWRQVNATPGLKALLVELSFPNELQRLADLSGHLTPRTLAGELAKLERSDLPVLLYHLKPAYVASLRREVAAMRLPNLRILKVGDTFRF